MRKIIFFSVALVILSGSAVCQDDPFAEFVFLLGEWQGTGSGFGNASSQIESRFTSVMDGKYIEVVNDSRFAPTEKNPRGEHHVDRGFISFDKQRKIIMFRQFNSEGYVNQYALNQSLSSEVQLVFETEAIENFVPGGKARWTIKKITDRQIETVFDVSFPGKEYACFGKNLLEKKR